MCALESPSGKQEVTELVPDGPNLLGDRSCVGQGLCGRWTNPDSLGVQGLGKDHKEHPICPVNINSQHSYNETEPLDLLQSAGGLW